MAKWSLQDSRVEIMYNPCEKPLSNFNLRDKLKIPHNAFVIGRVGRPDDGVYDPISILAYKEIETHNTYFLALSPPPKMIEDAKKLNLKNFIALNYIVDEVEMSKFYNTIDVLAHARRDGETFGCNLAEAMIHAKPCVSHLTDEMNGQVETIGDGGVVVEKDDVKSYAQALKKLLEDKKYYEELSRKAKKRAIENFDAETLTKRLEKIYLKLLE
jgi:glycosyltransferase involved in cell wall biosynthesis